MGWSGYLRTTASVLLLGALGFACSKQAETTLNLTAYNHTDEGISWYDVSSKEGGNGGAGFLDAGAGGGGYSCCVSIPSVWQPGLLVTVTRATIIDGTEKKVAEVVPIPRYDTEDATTLNVHFLRNGHVKVFVTRLMLGHRDYPLKGVEAEMKRGVPIRIRWP